MSVNMRPRTVQKTKAQKLAQRQLTTATPPLELETAPPDVAGNPPPACDDSAQMTVRYRELKAKLIEFSKTLATTSSSCDTASLRPAQVEGKLATLATMGEAIVHPPLGKDSTIAATFDGPVVGEHPGFDEPIKLWCNVSEYFYTLRNVPNSATIGASALVNETNQQQPTDATVRTLEGSCEVTATCPNVQQQLVKA